MIHFLMYCPELALRKKFPYSEFFWSVFSCIWTTYREIQSISPYSVRMRENTEQKNSEYRHFSRSVELRYRYITSSFHKNLWFSDASTG